MNLLVTGGAGFIGSHFIRYWLERYREDRVGNVDLVCYLLLANQIDTVVNFAAESHNSRAVLDPAAAIRTNVLGTQGLMEACRRSQTPRIHHVSTCEVFGDLP